MWRTRKRRIRKWKRRNGRGEEEQQEEDLIKYCAKICEETDHKYVNKFRIQYLYISTTVNMANVRNFGTLKEVQRCGIYRPAGGSTA
jgi:hypothetical protein